MATSAAALLNTPQDANSFDIWAFSLAQNIAEINAAILTQKGINLPAYPIYPVPPEAIGEWLIRVSEAVSQICGQTGVNSVDVENTDLNDDRERVAWAYSIFTEVNQARISLGI